MMIARPRHGRDGEEDEGDRQHGARLRPARGGEAGGADAVIVGAADAVAVVVRVVDADLDRDRDDEAAQGQHPAQRRIVEPGRTRADDHRRDGERSVRRRAAPIQSRAVARVTCAGSPDTRARCGLPRGLLR
jgi:hypothetical protein